MSKCAYIGALASLLLVCGPARAEWRTHIAGAPPILPTRFLPRTPRPRPAAPLATLAGATPILRASLIPHAAPPPIVPAALEGASDADAPIQFQWVTPLVDRRLGAAERGADIAPELIAAILRIEPMYDPTRLYGAALQNRMGVSAGTAAMDNVFADRWRRADLDANVDQRVAYIAMAWHRRGVLPCEAFSKRRARGYNQPALSALSRVDCAKLARTQARGDAVTLAPVVAARLEVPAFAAPMPGARLSSEAFWAQRRAEIARAEEELKLRRVWHGGKEGVAKTLVEKSLARR